MMPQECQVHDICCHSYRHHKIWQHAKQKHSKHLSLSLTHVTVLTRQWHAGFQLLLEEHIASSMYVMTEHQGANLLSSIYERRSAKSCTHHVLQGLSAKTARAFERGTHDAVSSRNRHASPELLAGCQGAHQGLQELVPRSHVPCQALPSPAGEAVATFSKLSTLTSPLLV